MSVDTEPLEFDSMDLLSLYTVMAVKRLVVSKNPVVEELKKISDVAERNITRLNINRKWFFEVLRDHARLYEEEWSHALGLEGMGSFRFNTYLLVVSLRLGMEKIWDSEEFQIHEEEELKDILEKLCPKLPLRELSQLYPMFEYYAQKSPNLEVVHMPRSDNNSFKRVMAYRNLRVLTLAGGVSDKVLCNCLWGIDKRSDKVLDLVLKGTKATSSVQLSLPHLEVLRNNIRRKNSNTMRVSLGAVALVLQPKLEEVETLEYWDTYDAVLYLLTMEDKYKTTTSSTRKLNVKCLPVDNRTYTGSGLRRVIDACPLLSEFSMFGEGTVSTRLLWGTFPSVKSIVVDFAFSDFYHCGIDVGEPFEIFKSFPELEELHFHNTNNVRSQTVVLGCLTHHLAHLTKLRHLSLISQLPGTYNPPLVFSLDLTEKLFEMQDTEDFKHLRQLETLQVDQLLLDGFLDMIIQMLRMSGVHVSVLYQTGVEKNDGTELNHRGPFFLNHSDDEDEDEPHEFSKKIFQKVN
ncbi:uncharacterized protein [Penaeus vannamei]|uniref:uncharacterized protein isoform X2 n=1 Tax=Penaeus vannamei TaxID=6689 RepID=UPI00387F76FD